MTSKNVCSICKCTRVSIGHLCPDCFSPKLVQFDADTNKRESKLPIFTISNTEYTHTDIDELLPIPELVEDPLKQHSHDPDEVSQSETSSLIADIEQTLRSISSEDDELIITPSKIMKAKKLNITSSKTLHPIKTRSRISKLSKKNEIQPQKQTAQEKENVGFEPLSVIYEKNEEHNAKVIKKKSDSELENKELSSRELKKLSKINIKKQLQELEDAINSFDKEEVTKIGFIDEIEEELEIPELVEDEESKENDKNAEITQKWDQIKDIRVSAVQVEKSIEKNYEKNKLPLKLAEYEQSIAMLLGSANFYELPVSWRIKARFKAFNDARVSLSEDQAAKVRHITLLEHKNEEYEKKKEKLITSDSIKKGSWKWFALTSIVHTVFLVMLWSVILIEAQPDDPDRVSFFDLDKLSTDIDENDTESFPDKNNDDAPANNDDKLIAEYKKMNDPIPDIPAIDVSPSMLDSKENKKLKSERPSVNDTQNLGISVSSKVGAEDGNDNEEEGTLLGHRTPGGKEGLLDKHGGNQKTVSAVNLGLKWLASQQKDDGSWQATDVPNGGKTLAEGYTGLALLCFLGDGHTASTGDYKDTVSRAVNYLIRKQSSSTGVISSSVSGMLYNHSLATLALSEYYAMTNREELIEPIKNALKFLYNSQQPSGGWDYTSSKMQNRSDMSITGWVVMAMHSIMASGIPVRKESWDAAYKGVMTLLKDDGAAYYSLNGDIYPYRSGLAMTAVSVLCRLYARIPSTDRLMVKSLRWLKSNLPRESKLRSTKSSWGKIDYRKLKNDDDFFHTTYYWYYGTLTMFMVTNGVGKDWNSWNNAMQKAVLGYQNTKKGNYQGSWDPKEAFWGEVGGRLYSTCLNILNLEIYYRYLPLYNKTEHQLRFDNNNDKESENEPDEDALLGSLINSISEATSIINDSTKPDSEKIIAITYLKLHKSENALSELINVLWNEKVSEMIRWRVVNMLADFPTKDLVIGALIDAYDIDFNVNLRDDILMSLAKLKRKNSLLYVVSKLDTQYEKEIRTSALKALESISTTRFGYDRTSWKIWINSNFK